MAEKQRVLIVDDDANIAELISLYLTKECYETMIVLDGEEALRVFPEFKPNIILLDLMLPGLNGEEVLPHLTGIPVIVLSARAAVEDKVDLLRGGAADYLTKPFDTRELLARVAVQLRRQSRQDGILRYRGIALAPETREAAVDGVAVRLTRTEFGILKLLMQNPRQVITKSQLLEQLSMDTPDCVEITLPGLMPRRKSTRGTEFLIDPLMAALERFVREHGVVRFPHYTVCFVMVYDRTLPERRIRDYDNLELKAVLDAAACFLMESDSGLLCDAYHSTELGETDCTRMFIVDSRCYPQWYAERQERLHAAQN